MADTGDTCPRRSDIRRQGAATASHMNPNSTLINTDRRHAGAAVSALLAFGPLASVWWVVDQAGSWGTANTAVAAWVLWFFWTPFAPFTFAAVALGDHRDRARLPGTGTVGRGALLVPWLVCSPHSTAKLATIANLVGITAAAWYLLAYLR